MKAMKTFAALLALAFSLAGCGAVDGDPVRPAPGSAGQGSSTAASGADSAEPEQLAALRQLAGENGDLAGVLYLGSVPERTTDVRAGCVPVCRAHPQGANQQGRHDVLPARPD